MDIEASIGLRLDGLNAEMRKLREDQATFNAEVREWARGVKYMRVAYPPQGTPTSVSIPGPDPGWAWDLKMFSCTLTGADSVGIYAGNGQGGDSANAKLLGYIPTVSATAPAQPLGIYTWSAHQALLFNGEGLFVATSGAFRFTYVQVLAVQVPAERIGALLA